MGIGTKDKLKEVKEAIRDKLNERAATGQHGTNSAAGKTDAELLEEATAALQTYYHPPQKTYFRNRDGKKLHCRVFMPPSGKDTAAVIVYNHGYTGNCNVRWGVEYFQLLAKHGYAVLTFDQPGHGHSEGVRARVESVDHWADNVEDLMTMLLTAVTDRGENCCGYTEQQMFNVFDSDAEKMFNANDLTTLRSGSLPIFIMGHSLGGLTCVFVSHRVQSRVEKYSMWARYKGTIFYSPVLHADRPNDLVCMVLKQTVPLVCDLDDFMPEFLSKSALVAPSDKFTCPLLRKIEEIDVWDGKDPTKHGWGRRMRWRTSLACVDAYMKLPKVQRELDVPFLIIHDPEDAISLIEGSELLMRDCKSKDSSFIKTPGTLHEIFANQPELIAQYTDVWMQARLGNARLKRRRSSL